jgi:hypothetical protein
MKINEIRNLNPVRKLFLEYFEDVKKVVEENIDEDLIKQVYAEYDSPMIDTVAVYMDGTPRISFETFYGKPYDMVLPNDTMLIMIPKYLERFLKIGINFPEIAFDLSDGTVFLNISYESCEDKVELLENYFTDMVVESDCIWDKSKNLFKF